MRRGLLILIAEVFVIGNLFGQSLLTIRGSIRDSTGARVANATIRLWRQSDSLQVLSGTDGEFTFSAPHYPGEWNIVVTSQGYHIYRNRFEIGLEIQMFILPPIIIQPEYQDLDSVIIKQERAYVIKGDTLDYNAATYSLREGAMLTDLLQELPGVTFTQDSSIYVMGEKIKKVLVDGRPYFDGDVRNAIRSLPYDLIDKVEIIDDFGDQAQLTGVKVGEKEKLLNVVLKKENRDGQFGNVKVAPGTQDQYIASATVNFLNGESRYSLNGGLTDNNPFGPDFVQFAELNYASRWGPSWSTTGDANLLSNHRILQNGILQDSYFAGGKTSLDQTNSTDTRLMQQQLDHEWVYSPGRSTKMRITTSISDMMSRETDQANISSVESDNGFQKTSQSLTLNHLNDAKITADTKLYFDEVPLHSGQRYSIDAYIKYSQDHQTGDNLIQSQIQSDSLNGQNLQQYQVMNKSSTMDIGGGIHYYVPMGSAGFFQSVYNIHAIFNKSTRNWLAPDTNGVWKPIDSLSNEYSSYNFVQDLKAGYIRHSDKTDIDIALVAEPGLMHGQVPGKGNNQSLHYFDIFPVGAINYTLNKSQKIKVGFTTLLTVPTIQQLQPVTDVSNPQYPITGNPNLRPAVSKSISLNYEWNSLRFTNYHGFGIGLAYETISAQIIPNIVHPQDTGVVVQQTYFVNLNGNATISINSRFVLPLLFNKHLKIWGWGTLSKSHAVSMSDYNSFAANTIGITQNLFVGLDVPEKIQATLYCIFTKSLTHYSLTGTPPASASGLTVGLTNSKFLFRYLILGYEFMQTYNSGISPRLSPGPTIFNIHLEKSFLKKKQLTASLWCINVLDEKAGLNQIITLNPTTITQKRADFVGRNILFKLQWNFERFSKMSIAKNKIR